MKKIIALLFILSSFALFGQSWCDAGANWKYSYGSGFGTEGYVEISYVGDTLIDTQLSQKLSKNLYAYNFGSSQPVNWFTGTEYTYEDNGVVFIRYNNSWDTLYNYNATIGESWRMAKQPWGNACDSNSTLTVIATGTTSINTISLNYKVVEFNYGGILTGITDTIIEKIGFTGSYMFPYDFCNGALDAQEGGPFRCYQDNSFATYKPHYYENCDYIVGIEENTQASEAKIVPNPATDQIEISGLSNVHFNYSIADLHGKTWLSGHYENSIIISELPSGMYVLTLQNDFGVNHMKFLKH